MEQIGRFGWMKRGQCRGLPTALFYPEEDEDPQEALEVCASCPVIKNCASYALRFEADGIWGGMTEDERIKRRKSLKIKLLGVNGIPIMPFHKSCGTESGYANLLRVYRETPIAERLICSPCSKAHRIYVAEGKARRARKKAESEKA